VKKSLESQKDLTQRRKVAKVAKQNKEGSYERVRSLGLGQALRLGGFA
jgi:hypothetical protein